MTDNNNTQTTPKIPETVPKTNAEAFKPPARRSLPIRFLKSKTGKLAVLVGLTSLCSNYYNEKMLVKYQFKNKVNLMFPNFRQ